MPTKNVNLTEHYSQFVESLIASGQYKNASEVFRAGLRLLEQSTAVDEQRLSLLRRLADEGFDDIDQGRGLELPTAKSLKSHIARLGRRAAKSSDGQIRSFACRCFRPGQSSMAFHAVDLAASRSMAFHAVATPNVHLTLRRKEFTGWKPMLLGRC